MGANYVFNVPFMVWLLQSVLILVHTGATRTSLIE
jgi:hypothetical protein